MTRNALHNWIEGINHWLFPSMCPGCCIRPVRSTQMFCTVCEYEMPYTDFHEYPENPVTDVFWGRFHLHSATCLLYFGAHGMVRRLIHDLKYKGRRDIGTDLGKRLGRRMAKSEYFNSVDMVIPVPLHPQKLRIRGYNQSEAIAEGVADQMQAILNKDVLRRSLHNPTQTRKSREERLANVEGIFELHNESDLAGKHILLVDDVLTTGATLEACAKSLVQIPGVRVSIATLAIATK